MDYKDIMAIVILVIVLVVVAKFFPNSKLGSMTKFVQGLFSRKS